jgi:hypothetical protein
LCMPVSWEVPSTKDAANPEHTCYNKDIWPLLTQKLSADEYVGLDRSMQHTKMFHAVTAMKCKHLISTYRCWLVYGSFSLSKQPQMLDTSGVHLTNLQYVVPLGVCPLLSDCNIHW